MKLFELITPKDLKYRDVKDTAWNKAAALQRDLRRNDDGEVVGTGAYSSVYGSEKDPGGVNKVGNPINSLSGDGYYQYLDMISRNDRMSRNPYFPKVYQLNTFKGKDGRYTFKVNMEKLHDFSTLSGEELVMLGRKMFTDFDQAFSEMRKNWLPYEGNKNRDPEVRSGAEQRGARDAIENMLMRALHHKSGVATNIKDPYLKQALTMLRHMVKTSDNEFNQDIHVGNIMVRRGPFTPQLVITDPLA